MSWSVLCDFDHTITKADVTDQLLEKYALPKWQHIETLWEKGFIGSRQCMEQQIALLRASQEEVDALADCIEVDAHFKSFVTFCKNKDIPLVILSDGLDYVIKRILLRQGIDHLPVIASHFEYIGDNRWELTAPFSNAACASQASTCKCQMARQLRNITDGDKLLYIGDGRSDYCVSMEEADFILAKSALVTYCEQQSLPHMAFDTFNQAQSQLSQLLKQEEKAPMRKEIQRKEAVYA